MALGWAWFSAYTLLGVLIMLTPLLGLDLPASIQSGRGSALQFVAAIIALAAIVPALLKDPNWLAISATSVATVFGIVGTWLVFAVHNPFWAVIIFGFTFVAFYATGAYLLFVSLISLVRLSRGP